MADRGWWMVDHGYGWMMKVTHFIDKGDDARIVAAIAAAERITSGEIRVYISHQARHDALAAARSRFLSLGMHKTRHRNAVLIYLVPRTHQFAHWGDAAIHEKCGEKFWAEITATIGPLFRGGLHTEAIEHAIKEIGAALTRHFPRGPDDSNELSNEIAVD